MTAHITGGYEQVFGELPLQGQIPVLNLCGFDVIHGSVITECDEGSVLSELDRKGIYTVKSCAWCRPGVVEYRVYNRRACSPRRYDRCPQMVLRIGVVVAKSRRSADGCLAVSAYIPCKSKAGRELPPVSIAAALSLKSRIARKSKAKRGLLKHGAAHTCGPSRLAVFSDSAERQCFGKIRFPTKAVIDSPPLIHF